MDKKNSVFVSAATGMFLSGCSSGKDIYNSTYAQVSQSIGNAKNSGAATLNTGINLVLYKFATGAKALTPAVVTGSVAIGILILMIIKKDPVWRKRAIFLFIVSIPAIMFMVSYGLAIMLSVFAF